jgi:hypothetical protein
MNIYNERPMQRNEIAQTAHEMNKEKINKEKNSIHTVEAHSEKSYNHK